MSLRFQKLKTFKRRKTEKGEAIVESTLCILLIFLILFGLMQVFYLYAAQMIFDYSAFCTARTASVGFADYLVERSRNVSAIGASGDLETGAGFQGDQNSLSQLGWERERIPEYIEGDRWLDYEYWPLLTNPNPSYSNNLVNAEVGMNYPLEFPFREFFTSREEIYISGEAGIMDYAEKFLE